MSAYLHSNLCALAQARPTHVLHVPSYSCRNSQSDIAGWLIGSYGELKGQDDCHTNGDWNDELDDLLGSVFKSSLQRWWWWWRWEGGGAREIE